MEVSKAVKSAEVAQRFQQLGIDPVGNAPQEYDSQIRNDFERYGRVVRITGTKID